MSLDPTDRRPGRVPRLSPTAAGLAAGFAAVGMWAAYLSFARQGVTAGLLPQDFVLLRYGTAGAVMLPWLLLNGPRTLGGVGWRRGAALALFAGPVFIALGVGGYVFAPLSHGAVIQPSALTLGGMAAAWLVFGERPTGARVAGVAVILAGLGLIALAAPAMPMEGMWRGDLLFVAAGLCWVAFTVLLRRWSIGGVPATAAVAVISAAVVIPLFALTQDWSRILALPLPILATQVVVQGLLSGVLAVIAYGTAVRHVGASRAALFPALVPAATLVVGLPVTGEMPLPLEWAGAALATAGLAVAMGVFTMRREARA